MNLNRRKFFRYCALLGICGVLGKFYLQDESMERPPANKFIDRKKYILADLHAHIDREIVKSNPKGIVKLISQGMIALTNRKKGAFSYDDALALCSANGVNYKEIEKGLFAEIRSGTNRGYIVKAQEVETLHHILALGCPELINPNQEPESVIKEVHKQGGIPILAHPYLLNNSNKIPRFPDVNEKKRIQDLAEMADEIESFNGHSIDMAPSFIPPIDLRYLDLGWLKRANNRSQKLADTVNKKGIAVSDAHYHLEQVRTSGIYIPDRDLSIPTLQRILKKQNFIPEQNYISRFSFLKSRINDLHI